MTDKVNTSVKARYWWFVFYPEHCEEGWEDNIADELQIPFCYIIHDKDKDGHDGDRKVHGHMILAFPNTTTYKNALEIAQEVDSTIKIVKKVKSMRHAYDYLIHDTEDCKKKCKYLYDTSERICKNNFDIGFFEQLSTEEKQELCFDLKNYIIKHRICNYVDLQIAVDTAPEFCEDSTYSSIMIGYKGYLESLCKGMYLKLHGKK